jgi:hypothetical protein
MVLPFPVERVTAVVGVAKNAGKTTTLNWLSEQLHDDNHCVGIFSIGYDGESQDFWLGIEKPPVCVHAGTLVAGAERLVNNSSATMQIIERIGIESPLGEIVIAQAATPGHIALAGLRHRKDWLLVRDRLMAGGADRVLIDGAYHRRALAEPGLADSVILATGAVLSSTVQGVVETTASIVHRLLLPVCTDAAHLKLLDRAVELQAPCWLDGDNTPVEETGRAAAMSDKDLVRLAQNSRTIAIPGAVPDRLLNTMTTTGSQSNLIICDATRLIVSDKSWQQFQQSGGNVLVRQPINLTAITVNPRGIRHDDLASNALTKILQQEFSEIPVIDVMQ